MEELYELARTLDVSSRIDWTSLDEQQVRAWGHTLHTLHDLCTRYGAHELRTVEDLDRCNLAGFTSNLATFREIKRTLTHDFDFSRYTFKDAPQEESSKGAPTPTPTPCATKVQAYVVDIDYEYRGTQKILMYTRDCKDPARTYLCTFDYGDYFYIKVTEEYPAPALQKIIRGYVRFMQEKFYPAREATPGDRRHISHLNYVGCLVHKMEVCYGYKSMYGYQAEDQVFLRVRTACDTVTRDLFKFISRKHPTLEFFECTVGVLNKFMTEYGVRACAAFEFEGRACAENTLSTCTAHIECDAVRALPDVVFKPKVLYYDIECLAEDINVFPTADRCPVIQISYLLMYGTEEQGRGVLCLGETPGYESYETEEQVLLRFTQIVRAFNPDTLTGFNSNNFDMPYIVDRAHALGIFDIAGQISRRKGVHIQYKRTTRSSKQFGTKEIVTYKCPGRTLMDQYEIIKADATKRLLSYSLKSICEKYLKEDNKEDLAYREIPSLFTHPEGRVRIASYCLKDTLLLERLDRAMMIGMQTWGLTTTLGVTLDECLNRGISFKLMCKLKQYTERFKLLIPSFTEPQRPTFSGKYQGAFVLEPQVGFYKDPVCVFDFKSLYPSMIISNNLSYDTIILDTEWARANPTQVRWCCGVPFIKKDIYEGIIPLVEKEMALERERAKAAKAAAPKGSVEQGIYDSAQLACKLILNSMYGILGSPTSMVPCVQIASTITGLGREHLLEARDYICTNYHAIIGAEEAQPACYTVYGDTDSVFICTPGCTLAESMRIGKAIEEHLKVALHMGRESVELEFEKVYAPFFIQQKKKYVGIKYEKKPVDGELSAMGLSIVKRDAPVFCKAMMSAYFEALLHEQDMEKALRVIKLFMTRLYGRDLPWEDFVLSKKISRRIEDYANVPAHVLVWKKLLDRVGPAEAPSVGERFEYIIVETSRGRDLVDTIQDVYTMREMGPARASDVQINYEYYHRVFVDGTMRDILTLVHGENVARVVLNPQNYEQKRVIRAEKGNLVGFFFGKDSVVQKKRKHGFDLENQLLEELQKKISTMNLLRESLEADPEDKYGLGAS